MRKIISIIIFTFTLTSCTENEIVNDFTSNSFDHSLTRSAGDSKSDVLGYGYNCLYSNFTNPLYAKAPIIDIKKLESGIGKNQITRKEVVFNPTKILEAQLHGLTESRVAYGTSIQKLTETMRVHVESSLNQEKILKLFFS